MKALGLHFSTFLFGLCLISGGGTVHAAATPCAQPKPTTLSNDAAKRGYPTFCSIPPAPSHLRSPAAFRDAVLDTRRAGRDLVRESGPQTFGLAADSAAPFASQARREAAPPPAMNPQDVIEAEAFAREARKRAAPPKNPH
jgi:hypothetical protein